jgi:transcriptional regulator with XRE-family HTH domain
MNGRANRPWLLAVSPRSLGQRVRFWRIARGWSQTRLASEASKAASIEGGLTKSFLSLVESDQTSPSVKSLHGLATALGVTMDHLVTGEKGRKRQTPPVDRSLLRLAEEAYDRREAIGKKKRVVALAVLLVMLTPTFSYGASSLSGPASWGALVGALASEGVSAMIPPWASRQEATPTPQEPPPTLSQRPETEQTAWVPGTVSEAPATAQPTFPKASTLTYNLGLDAGSLWRSARIGFALQGEQAISGAFGLQENIATGDTARAWTLRTDRAPWGFSFATEFAPLTQATTYGVSHRIGDDNLFLFSEARRTITLPSVTLAQQSSDVWTYSLGVGGIPVAGASLAVALQHTGGFVVAVQGQDGWNISGEFALNGGPPVVHLTYGGAFTWWKP